MYQQSHTQGIILHMDGRIIPCDVGNADYRAFLEWESAGNEISPPPEDVSSESDKAKRALASSDSRMPRISEDAIRALISKGVLSRDLS